MSWLRRARRRPRVAFVLGGGGNLGALQVGMLRALLEHGIRPDIVLGCSVGALNGAAVAADPTDLGVARLEALWRRLDGDEVFPGGWPPTPVQLARKGESVHGNEGLRGVIDDVIAERSFADLELRFECVATARDDGREHWFTEGPVADAVLASAAIPAIFPPVEIGGTRYLDGAVVNDVPVTRAAELGVRQAYVLHVGDYEKHRPEPKRPIDAAVHAYWLFRQHRLRRDLAALPRRTEAILLPTGDVPDLAYDDLSHSHELIVQAYAATSAHLDAMAGVTEPRAVPAPVEPGPPHDDADDDNGDKDDDKDDAHPPVLVTLDGHSGDEASQERPGGARP